MPAVYRQMQEMFSRPAELGVINDPIIEDAVGGDQGGWLIEWRSGGAFVAFTTLAIFKILRLPLNTPVPSSLQPIYETLIPPCSRGRPSIESQNQRMAEKRLTENLRAIRSIWYFTRSTLFHSISTSRRRCLWASRIYFYQGSEPEQATSFAHPPRECRLPMN